jgi:hypothetical protein
MESSVTTASPIEAKVRHLQQLQAGGNHADALRDAEVLHWVCRTTGTS